MPVTKQTYTANAPWTRESMADMLRDAFIDAGLMTAWHDSFTNNLGTRYRVLKIEHDNTKTYGNSFYAFSFTNNASCFVWLASGWNASGTPPVNVPTGTQYLDYAQLPDGIVSAGSGVYSGSFTSNLFLDRYTSQDDSKQSWFVFRQPGSRSLPFSVLHPNTTLHPWLNLDQGMISGFQEVPVGVSSRSGFVSFTVEENLRRCLVLGTALRGVTSAGTFSNLRYNAYSYLGLGNENSFFNGNFPLGIRSSLESGVILPVGKSVANPGFVTDYIPVCTELPWSPWTPTLLANDFGICMYYDDNGINYGDRIIVQSALNEWQVINQANNANVNDGASATFLARLI